MPPAGYSLAPEEETRCRVNKGLVIKNKGGGEGEELKTGRGWGATKRTSFTPSILKGEIGKDLAVLNEGFRFTIFPHASLVH